VRVLFLTNKTPKVFLVGSTFLLSYLVSPKIAA
jgi:hypothetical protein